jgi:hypothetical protein
VSEGSIEVRRMIHKGPAGPQHSIRPVEAAPQCHRIMPCRCRTPGTRGSRPESEISRSQAGCLILSLAPILRTPKLLVRRPHAPDIGVWASEDFPTTTCFRRFDMSVGTSASAVRNHHGGNSFRVSHVRTAPVVGYGRPKDHPRRTAFTRSFSEMESIINTKRNTDGLQRPWCTLGLSTTITLRSLLDRPSRLYSGHRGLLGVALLRHALGNRVHGQRAARVAAMSWSTSQTPSFAPGYGFGHALEFNNSTGAVPSRGGV